MPIYRIDAILPYVTNLPRDVSINTFHVEAPGMTGDQLNAVHGAIPGFYNNDLGTDPVGKRLSAYISRGTDDCLVTIREVGETGPPLDVFPWTLTAADVATSLPFEVAVCLSYNSLRVGVPRGRSRGRIFLGPLVAGSAAMTLSSDVPPRVATAFQEDLALAADELAGALSGYDVDWGVYSRVDEELYVIEQGYIDNAFDTQRRREVDASGRTTWTVT